MIADKRRHEWLIDDRSPCRLLGLFEQDLRNSAGIIRPVEAASSERRNLLHQTEFLVGGGIGSNR